MEGVVWLTDKQFLFPIEQEGAMHISNVMHLVSAYSVHSELIDRYLFEINEAYEKAVELDSPQVVQGECQFFFMVSPRGDVSLCLNYRTFTLKSIDEVGEIKEAEREKEDRLRRLEDQEIERIYNNLKSGEEVQVNRYHLSLLDNGNMSCSFGGRMGIGLTQVVSKHEVREHIRTIL